MKRVTAIKIYRLERQAALLDRLADAREWKTLWMSRTNPDEYYGVCCTSR